MTPKEERHKKNIDRKDSFEDEENEATRLLSQDPIDWVLKNENVLKLISVRFELLCW